MAVVHSDTEEDPTARVNRPRDTLTSFLLRTRGEEEGADVEARLHLQSLKHNDRHGVINSIANEYGHGTWGYTVLRTVYTPESDHLFPQAIEKLKKWVHYELHAPRFCGYGAYGESRKIPNPVYNDELWKRFHLDVVEDRALLQCDDPRPEQDQTRLSNFFRKWVASTENASECFHNPRFLDCILINNESMQSLVALSDETPPLKVFSTRNEMCEWPGWSKVDSFVWLLDSRGGLMSQEEKEDCWYYGKALVKLEIRDIRSVWFHRQNRSGEVEGLRCREGNGQDSDYLVQW